MRTAARLAAGVLFASLAACGRGGAAADVQIHLSEWKFQAPESISSAPSTWFMENTGVLLHEVLIIRTDADAASLPVTEGMVDLDAVPGELVAEVAEVTPEHPAEATVQLDPGRYLLICNLAGHYASGMHTVLMVTDG